MNLIYPILKVQLSINIIFTAHLVGCGFFAISSNS